MQSVRILLVDDNPQIHEDFRSIFLQKPDEKRGRLFDLFQKITGAEPTRSQDENNLSHLRKTFILDSAYQGDEACRMMRQAASENRPYALAFVDVRMPPGMDGIQTIQKMWAIDPEIQVIICTAYSDRTWEEIFFLLNPEDNLLILKKPFDLSEVLQIAYTMSEKWATSRVLKETNERLAKANKTLEQLVELQQTKMIESYKLAHLGEMASGIAHELNTPITVIKLRAQQAKRLTSASPPDIEKALIFLDVINSTCDRMTKIITGLLHFARDPKLDDKGHFNLKQVLDSALILCGEKFKHNSINLMMDVPDDLNIHCNSVQMSQVFLNLLSNSFDSIVGLDERWVKVRATATDRNLVITVMDSGKRISQDIAGKIMHPFFTTKPIGKGTGLGLSISHGIIQQHDGVLEIDTESENMAFKISLPLNNSNNNS